MAITNATLVKFSNERARVLADVLGFSYYYSKLFVDLWNANNGDVVIPDDSGQTVVDGSSVDGRVPVTGADLHRLKELADEWIALLEASTALKRGYILSVAVNPERVTNG